MNKNRNLPLLALLIAAFFWGVVFSFPDFFFFNPLDQTSTLRQLQLLISSVGWVLLSTGLPIALLLIADGHQRLVKALPYLSLLWPISVASTQITLFFQNNEWYLGYLKNYPVFIVTEIILPLCGMLIWRQLREDSAQVVE